MEISRRTDYGVRLMVELAGLPESGRASAQEIASRQNIPRPFLAKIVSQLSLAGLVTTFRGAGGGVALSRPAAQINLLEVIEALEGPIQLNRCVMEPQECPRIGRCSVHDIWSQAQADLVELLHATTFADLARDAAPVRH